MVVMSAIVVYYELAHATSPIIQKESCHAAMSRWVAEGLAVPRAEMRRRTGSLTGTLSHKTNLTDSLGGGGWSPTIGLYDPSTNTFTTGVQGWGAAAGRPRGVRAS